MIKILSFLGKADLCAFLYFAFVSEEIFSQSKNENTSIDRESHD